MAKKLISFKLEEEVIGRLKTAAFVNKTTMTEIVENLLRTSLAEMTQDTAWEQFKAMPDTDKLEFSRKVEAEAKKITSQDEE